jgi:hypothetical protein
VILNILNSELLGTILLLLVGAGVFIERVVEFGRNQGWIPEGAASVVVQIISFALPTAMTVIGLLGRNGEVAEVQTVALQMAAALVAFLSLSAVAKVIHEGFKLMSGETKIGLFTRVKSAGGPVG